MFTIFKRCLNLSGLIVKKCFNTHVDELVFIQNESALLQASKSNSNDILS